MKVFSGDLGDLGGPERGTETGRRWAPQIRTAVRRYADFFRHVGIDGRVHEIAAASMEATGAWAPGLADEMVDIARGADLPVEDVVALNARTEILVAARPDADGECSTLVMPGTGRSPLCFQTWDWHPELAPSMVQMTYRPVAGRRVTTLTEPGMLAKIGVNDAGLGLHFNLLRHAADRPTGGVPVHIVARRVLDEARTVADAVAIAASADVAASSVLTVVETGAARRRAASIELSPAGLGLVEPDAAGCLVHTNHFLDGRLSGGQVTVEGSTSVARLDHLVADRTVLEAATQQGDPADWATTLLPRLMGEDGSRTPVRVEPDPAQSAFEQWGTLIGVLIDPVASRLHHRISRAARAHSPQEMVR